MKKMIIAALAIAPLTTFAAGSGSVILSAAHTKEVPYVAQIEVMKKTAWEGTEIVRIEDGTCRKVTQSNLVLHDLVSPEGTIQAPSVESTVVEVKCPS